LKKVTAYREEPEIVQKLNALAKKRGVSRGALIRKSVEKMLNDSEGRGEK
jgi:predicted DNA-binding protein